ncbi:Thioredoxin domain-containing protein 15 [Lemmus lemmus]
MASVAAARSQDGDPQPRLRSQVSSASPSPQPGWGRGRAFRCRAPVVVHRGGCRRCCLSPMRLLCWWQVLLWVLGLPARSLEGECGPGRGSRLRGGDALFLARPAAVRCGAARGGAGRRALEAEPA